MAVRCLVKFDMLMGDSMSEKSDRAKWRGVLMLTVLTAQPGSEKFMFAVW